MTIRLSRAAIATATLLLGVGAAVPLACFSLKEPPCAFTCVEPPHRCPDQYTCGTDFLCHRQGAAGRCIATPPGDAGTEAGDSDASNAPDADDDAFFP